MLTHRQKGIPPHNSSRIPLHLLTPRRKGRIGKPRLVYDCLTCKFTFPRSYELRRHHDGIHKHTASLLCPIYNRERATKPFPRFDKFNEHMKGHQNPERFLCGREIYRISPLTTQRLREHVASVQINDYGYLTPFRCLRRCFANSWEMISVDSRINKCHQFAIFHITE
jgi:hypothetical protein